MSPSRVRAVAALSASAIAILPAAPGAAQDSSPLDARDATPLPEVQVARKPAPRSAVKRSSRPAPAAAPLAAVPADVPTGPPTEAPVAASQSVSPLPVPAIVARPAGQPVTTVDRDRFRNAPAFSIGDVLQDSPGISVKQGNGPRDVGISIRGSNARNGFGIRNVVVQEDGFPVTQPDGLSRTDITDPHAYGGIDVYRGPSSALFGNYATGGAINFRTRRGAEIAGFESGSDIGQFNYFNNYMTLGRQSGPFEYALFASDVRGEGFTANSKFNTQTVNLLAGYDATPNDRVTVKLINNNLDTQLPLRLSLAQFQQNPFQNGCAVAGAAPGCASVNLLANGFSPPAVAQSAAQAGLGRDDRRTVVGARWEHSFDNATVWRTQFVFDDKNIDQPTGATTAIGDSPAFNVMTDITRQGALFGLDATHFVQLFYNNQVLNNATYNVMPGGNARLGSLVSSYDGGQHENAGARAREEIRLGAHWTALLGVGVEHTSITAVNNAYSYSAAGLATISQIPVDRQFLNAAPEAGLVYQPNAEWQFRGRVATGYGTPQIGNLLVTPQGVPGNNTQLQAQTNLGFDLGADWRPSETFTLSVTGIYEFFRNELVTQSPGAGLQNFTFNAPASAHRGVEIAADWRPAPGWRVVAAYTYDDQIYTEYVERLSAGALTSAFDRAGNKIPGVAPNELTARLGYDQPFGPWKGVGGFVEFQWRDAFFIDNANLVKAPAYQLVNVNVHYNTELADPYVKGLSLFFEVRNVFDTTYVASANNVANSISAVTGAQNPAGSVVAATGSIYAGAPRTFLGGIRLAFR
jgi:iron complex outermembrane receptor protein